MNICTLFYVDCYELRNFMYLVYIFVFFVFVVFNKEFFFLFVTLGFMSTLDDHSRGNYGIYDVLKVLQFIQSHIHKFCGDPNRVTLVGFGSGAAIAGILTLSPKSIYQGTLLQHVNILYIYLIVV